MTGSVALAMMALTAAPASAADPRSTAPPPAHVLLVVAPRNFEQTEYAETRAMLEAAGAHVRVATKTRAAAMSMSGLAVEPDLLIVDARAEDFDAIVVIGGVGVPEALNEDPALRALLQDAARRGRVVAAICLAPVVLARAGLLKGVRATVNPMPFPVQTLEESGALYVDQDVVVSGRIVTGRGPPASRAFGRAVAAALGLESAKPASLDGPSR